MLSVALKGKRGDFELDVAFDIRSGVTALHGPSGAGKTSILRGICGHWVPDAGRVNLNGTDLFATREETGSSRASINVAPHERGIGAVFQTPLLFPHMDVRKNLLYSAPSGSDIFDAVVSMLDLGGLLDRMPRNLSGGEAQRVALGRALISQPGLLLLDEPLTGLDEARRENVFPYLERLCDTADIPVVYVSHNRAEIERLAQRVLMIDSGRITGDMTIEQFSQRAG